LLKENTRVFIIKYYELDKEEFIISFAEVHIASAAALYNGRCCSAYGGHDSACLLIYI